MDTELKLARPAGELINYIVNAGFFIAESRRSEFDIHDDIKKIVSVENSRALQADENLQPVAVAWNNSGDVLRRAVVGLCRSVTVKLPVQFDGKDYMKSWDQFNSVQHEYLTYFLSELAELSILFIHFRDYAETAYSGIKRQLQSEEFAKFNDALKGVENDRAA